MGHFSVKVEVNVKGWDYYLNPRPNGRPTPIDKNSGSRNYI
jgi:hypothetical protein